MSAPLRTGLTRADLDERPDDGNRYELVDGRLLVTPAPSPLHQISVVELLALFRAAAQGTDLLVLPAPLDVVLADDTVVEPDVVVVRRDDLDARGVAGLPLLLVEVLSPGTRGIDQGLKRARYERAGVPHLWLFDPFEPQLTALRLLDGKYEQVAQVRGSQPYHASEPFAVVVVPDDLVAPLRG